MKCPNCGSSDLQKKGTRAGKQKYRCKKCSASFTEGVPYKKQIKYPKVTGISCPKCGGTHIIRDGKLEGSGAQRYQCQECHLNFSANTSTLKEIQWNCPYCGGKLTYSGYSRKGLREYRCSVCDVSCTGDETGKPIKRTIMGDESITLETFTQEDKDSIIKAILAGKNINKTAQQYNCNPSIIKALVKPSYKLETINKDQLEMIIKFGIHLRVPVDYMAEYVGCSEHKCTEVINKYKKKFMSTTHGAT